VQDFPQLRFGEGRLEEGGGLVKGEGDRRAHEHPWCRRCPRVLQGFQPRDRDGGDLD
jgi:hypothetical protein